MALLLTYELTGQTSSNRRNYIQGVLQRCRWQLLGGSVYQYSGNDFFNEALPALNYIRAFIIQNNIQVKFLTLTGLAEFIIDNQKNKIVDSAGLSFDTINMTQGGEQGIRNIDQAAVDAAPTIA